MSLKLDDDSGTQLLGWQPIEAIDKKLLKGIFSDSEGEDKELRLGNLKHHQGRIKHREPPENHNLNGNLFNI